MTAKLKFISTPIGNLKDITQRAFEELSQAKFILAEDTRHTKNLLSALGILEKNNPKLVSCHAHNEKERVKLVLEKLKMHEDVIFVSDAGCPGISDPGLILAKSVIDAGFDIEILPGVSALTTSLMGAGLNTARFVFLGFLPKTKGARKKILERSKESGLALVIFESPLRVIELLQELHEIMGNCPVVVARELTKKFETFHRGILGQSLNPPLVEKGECVVIVEGHLENQQISDEEIIDYIKKSFNDDYKTKDIVKQLMAKFNINKNQAYSLTIKALS